MRISAGKWVSTLWIGGCVVNYIWEAIGTDGRECIGERGHRRLLTERENDGQNGSRSFRCTLTHAGVLMDTYDQLGSCAEAQSTHIQQV